MKGKVLIIGASSGIGKELAKVYSEAGFEVGLVARRVELLQKLQSELPAKSYICQVDVTKSQLAQKSVQALIQEMQGVDIVIVNSGVYFDNPEMNWEKDKEIIDVNVTGFTAMANVAIAHFLERGQGHLVGISSISAVRGEAYTPVYNASKAFVSTYLEGIRNRMAKEKRAIFVTDILPGCVDTDMTKGMDTAWMVSSREAALEIYQAVEKKRSQSYVSSRWKWYAWAMKWAPNWLYDKFF